MKNILLVLFAVCSFLSLKSQSNVFPPTGNAGVGTGSPAHKIEVVSNSSNSTVIGATGLDYLFQQGFYDGTADMNPVFGFPLIGAGLINFNDGYQQTIGMVYRNKLVWDGYASTTEKVFRLNNAENNKATSSLELRNNGSYVYTGPNWISKPKTSIIVAWNQALTIGTNSSLPLKIYASSVSSGNQADIFIQNSKIGIGTEAPNTNSKLDVNGNIYSNGKVFIGIPDGNTAIEIADYSLAVDGAALFTKAVVKLKDNWPDYVFAPDYKMPKLAEIESFIKENGHLPEMPTASDVGKNGINLGNTQVLLLKKIEELTLILIEQEKRIKELEERN